jgi:hypothetical protein
MHGFHALPGNEAKMRNDDHDEIDLSQHRASRLPGIMVIVAALGVALIAAWVFTPILMSKDSAITAGLFNKTKPRPAAPPEQPAAAPALASAPSTPVVPAAPPQPETAAATDDEAATLGPTVASAGASAPWPQDRGIQVAATAPAATPMQVATAEPADIPAEPFDNVPLPRKRPSRLIAASLVIPLPRPRPDIEPDPSPEQSTFDLQVERMR